MYRDAQRDRRRRIAGIECRGVVGGAGDSTLDGARPGDGIERARKFGEQAVAGRLDEVAALAGEFRMDDLAQQGGPARERRGLLLRHQDGIANDVDEGDGGQATAGHIRGGGRAPVGRRMSATRRASHLRLMRP